MNFFALRSHRFATTPPAATTLAALPLDDFVATAYHAAGKATAAIFIDHPVHAVGAFLPDPHLPGGVRPTSRVVLAPFTSDPRVVDVLEEMTILMAGFIVYAETFAAEPFAAEPHDNGLFTADEQRLDVLSDLITPASVEDDLWRQASTLARDLIGAPRRQAVWKTLAHTLLAERRVLDGPTVNRIVRDALRAAPEESLFG